MAKKEATPPWYEVLEQSYIGDRLYQIGDRVQFDGEAGANLRELSAAELKTAEPAKTDDDLLTEREKAADLRDKDQDKRDSDLADREKAVDAKEQEVSALADANDARAKELDDREAAVSAKEAAVTPTAATTESTAADAAVVETK